MNRVIVLLSALALPTIGLAQTPARVLEDALRKNWYVRYTLDDSTTGAGRIRRVDATAAVIGSSLVNTADITLIERRIRQGGGWKTGALVGATTFAGSALLIVMAFCGGNCSAGDNVGSLLVGASVGAPLGAFVGEFAKPPRRVWVRVWPG